MQSVAPQQVTTFVKMLWITVFIALYGLALLLFPHKQEINYIGYALDQVLYWLIMGYFGLYIAKYWLLSPALAI